MTSADVTLVAGAVAAWDRGDLEALLRHFHPEFSFYLSGQIPGQPLEIHGHDEYVRFFEAWLSSWDSFELTAERIGDIGGGRVLTKTRQVGVGRDGVRTDRVVWFLADIERGRIVRYAAFVDERAALDAAGVDEWPDADDSRPNRQCCVPACTAPPRERGDCFAGGRTGIAGRVRVRAGGTTARSVERGGIRKRIGGVSSGWVARATAVDGPGSRLRSACSGPARSGRRMSGAASRLNGVGAEASSGSTRRNSPRVANSTATSRPMSRVPARRSVIDSNMRSRKVGSRADGSGPLLQGILQKPLRGARFLLLRSRGRSHRPSGSDTRPHGAGRGAGSTRACRSSRSRPV